MKNLQVFEYVKWNWSNWIGLNLSSKRALKTNNNNSNFYFFCLLKPTTTTTTTATTTKTTQQLANLNAQLVDCARELMQQQQPG